MSDFSDLFKDYISGIVPKYKTIDGAIERLNRRTIATILVIFGLLTTKDSLMAHTIKCNGFSMFGEDFVQDYCWTQGLFVNRYAYDLPKGSLPAPGIVPCIRSDTGIFCSEEEMKHQIVYHLWYQWVTLYFFLSAALFWSPYTLSKVTILGSLSRFVDVLEEPSHIIGKGKTPEKISKILATWCTYHLHTTYGHPWYANIKVPFLLIFYKCLYLLVSSAHFWLTAKMFPLGNYYTLGTMWFKPGTDNYTHIGDVLFPKMAGCQIKRFGPSGLYKETGMCNLAPNVVNQYLFFLTWWMTVIAISCNIMNILLILVDFKKNSVFNNAICYDKPHHHDHPSNIQKDKWYHGATKKDMKLVFAYYNLGGRIIINKIADNIHPVILSFGIKYIADNIRLECVKNAKLKACLSNKLNTKDPGTSRNIGFNKNGYKKLKNRLKSHTHSGKHKAPKAKSKDKDTPV